MDGFSAYKYFMAVRVHFTNERYDVFEKNGRTYGTREAFEKRNDCGIFEKLAKKFPTDREYIQFLVANFAYGNRAVVYSAESFEYYQLWQRRKESRTRHFQLELNTIINHFEVNHLNHERLYSIETGMPELLNLYLGGYVSIETMVILQALDNYLPDWEPLIMLWHDSFLTIRKCEKFVKYDADKIRKVYDNFKERLQQL